MQFKSYNEIINDFKNLRFYKTPDGKKVPSVTTVLKVLQEPPALSHFKQYDKEGFNKMLQQKAIQGTELHKNIASTFKGVPKLKETGHHMSFFYFYTTKGRFWKPLKIEDYDNTFVYCDNYAGTYDALMEIDNVPTLIDWKTYGQRLYEELIFKYKLQISAYSKLVNVPHAKIVLFNGKNVKYNIIDVDDIDKYYNLFLQALDKFNEYYNAYTSSTSKTY